MLFSPRMALLLSNVPRRLCGAVCGQVVYVGLFRPCMDEAGEIITNNYSCMPASGAPGWMCLVSVSALLRNRADAMPAHCAACILFCLAFRHAAMCIKNARAVASANSQIASRACLWACALVMEFLDMPVVFVGQKKNAPKILLFWTLWRPVDYKTPFRVL